MASPQSDLSSSPSTTAKDDKDDSKGQDKEEEEDEEEEGQRRSSSPAPGPPTPPAVASSLDGNMHSSSPVPIMAPSSSPPFSPSPPAISPLASPPHDPSPEPDGAKTPTNRKVNVNHSAHKEDPIKMGASTSTDANQASSSQSHPDSATSKSHSIDKNSDSSPYSPSEETVSRLRRKRKRSGAVVEGEVGKVVGAAESAKSDAGSSSPSKPESHLGEEDGNGEGLDMEEVNPDMMNGQTGVLREGSSSTVETLDSSHSDADGETFSDEWMADMRRVKVSD